MVKLGQDINVLIIEDSVADAFLIGEYLAESEDTNFHSYHYDNMNEALDFLTNNSIDIVLVDLHLPDSSGPIGLQRIFNKFNNTPFIVLTGLSDKNVAITLLQKGAKDYLVKGEFDNNLLERSILYTLERQRAEIQFVQDILAAQDAEKERIARDVHDTLGQNLNSALMQIQSLSQALRNTTDENKETIKLAIRSLNNAIAESRGIARSLMPQTVQRFGLESGIESILMSLGENSSTQFILDSEIQSQRFPENIELTFFRIAQESISNILKYAKATTATIGLRFKNDYLTMQIKDDGIGFDKNDPENLKGVGLTSMRTRANSIAGRFEIKSEEGLGTIISIVAKIEKEEVYERDQALVGG